MWTSLMRIDQKVSVKLFKKIWQVFFSDWLELRVISVIKATNSAIDIPVISVSQPPGHVSVPGLGDLLTGTWNIFQILNFINSILD